ncbi:cytochrome c553 [Bacillus sp. SLBN-46]|uniref:hypothetical protein n=1 Tax=Bacillus sp. SLBN-46 TaxID=3042283 RepID=UPI002861C2BD|nr:hypothetical protein [Bacillus sp. SLBN-46]MDR6121608.1 cytochrome c553 [Bacillus sp. SLBN-46]
MKFKWSFSPTSLLQASTTYYILINPLLIDQDPQNPNWTADSSGNPLLPVIKKFTTERESDVSKISADKQALHHMSDPHGDNGMNTNTCGNCHSTHTSNLRDISDEPTTQGENLEQPNFNYSSYNYCMACHDGTVAPAPENMHQNGHYPEYGSTSQGNEKYSAGDCASCHNPHLTWSKENPNRLKDHFVHLHNDYSKQNNVNYPYGNNQEDAIDSLVQPCETCHDSDAQKVKDQYVYKHKDATIQNNPNYPTIQNGVNSLVEACEGCHEHKNVSELVRLVKEHDSINKDDLIAVNYKIIQYGSSSATGVTDDYGLCFRCHNGNKKWTDKNNVEHTISNIKQYYDVNEDTDPTKGSQSMHRITAIDGSSKLLKSAGTTANDGHIPCAVCHDTHGSSNIILLKNILGFEDRQSFDALETDKNSFGVLNDTKERQFCLSCHNGSTAIYGVNGRELDSNLSDGHRDTDIRACSACHGLGTTPKDKALSAAHAPTSGKP